MQIKENWESPTGGNYPLQFENADIRVFEIPLYGGEINVVLGKTCKDAIKAAKRLCKIKKIGKIAPKKPFYGAVFEMNANFFLVLFDMSVDSQSIAHEANHIVINKFKHIGLPINKNSAEAFCYLQQYILFQIERCIAHSKNKLKPILSKWRGYKTGL